MDVFTPEKRSEVMSRIRGHDTKPELALRSMLHQLGYRFHIVRNEVPCQRASAVTLLSHELHALSR